jgi:hypothetical protein
VALDDVTEGWVTVERKVALPPPPRRAGSDSSTKVAICFFTVGVSSHLRQADPSHLLRHLLGHHPLGHLHRRHHHVQVSLLLVRRPLSLPPLHGGRPHLEGHVGVRGGSDLKRDGGGAWWRQGEHGGRGDEAPLLPLLEAVEALPLLPSPKRLHCSSVAVETLPLLDRGLRRSGNNVRPHLPRWVSTSRARSGSNVFKSGLQFFFILKKRF